MKLERLAIIECPDCRGGGELRNIRGEKVECRQCSGKGWSLGWLPMRTRRRKAEVKI